MAIQNYLRLYQLLRWIEALNDGFDRGGYGSGIQPATASNITMYLLEHDAMPAIRSDRKRKTGDYEYLRNHVNQLLRRYRTMGTVSRSERIPQTRANHLAVRKGTITDGGTVYQYELTKSGEKMCAGLADYFDKKNDAAEHFGVTERDTVIVPEKGIRWRTTTLSVSRIDPGPLDFS